MKQIKRILALMLALLFITSFAACSDGDVVIESDGGDISRDEYRYFYMNYKLSDPDANEKELHTLTREVLKRDRAILLLAQEYGIELTALDEKELDTYVSSLTEEQGGEEEFEKYLSENYLTEELFRYLYSQKKLESYLRDHMINEANNLIPSDDASFEKDLEKNFMAAKQILIRNDTQDKPEDNKALAKDIFARINAGEDFDTLAEEYNEDESADPRYGRYFTKNMLLPEFEEAVGSIGIGELYPEVLESSVGFHIILRMPLDDEYIDENYNTLRDYYLSRCFNEIVEEKAASLDFTLCDGFENIDFEEEE